MGGFRAGAIPGLLNQPTGQVIDGSVLIDGHFGGSYPGKVLNRTPSFAGNNKTWTLSYWFKKVDNGAAQEQMFVAGTGPAVRTQLYLNDHKLRAYHTESPEGTNYFLLNGTALLRDFGPGWYHICWVSDIPNGTFKCYVNNRLDMDGSVNTSYITQVNLAHQHTIGNHSFSDYNNPFTGRLSQMYMVDGQALDPSYFGFTDPLTNTWKPKKYTGGFNNYTLTAPTYNSGQGSDVTTSEFDKMVDGDLSTYGQGNGASGTNRFIGFSLPADAYPSINVKIKNTTGSALDFIVQPSVTGQGLVTQGNFASNNNNNGTVNVPAYTTHEDTYSFPSGYEGFGRIYLNNNGNAADAWEIYDFGGTKVTTNSFYLPMDGNSPIGQDKSGNGNDWTPQGFGGSLELDNPNVSGARPILNTTQGGTQAGVGVRTDAYASNLFLALPLVGNTNDVSNQINSGSTTKIATNSSVTASSTQSNFYGGSHHWNAASDTLQYAEQGNELVFGTGDYTIECWLYDDNGHNGGGSGRCYIFDNRIGGSVVGDPPTLTGYIDNHNSIKIYDGASTITHTVSDTRYRWIHYAVTREGTTTRMFVDGVLVGSSTNSTNFTNNGIGIGRATDANYGWAGYIQDFRVYKGVAKYTSDFVVPATSPDILPDTPSGVSGSSKLTKITDGAVAFDGTNDTLSVADSDDFTFGSGDFTMEAFVYNKSSGYRSIVQKYGGAPASSSWFWSMYNGQNNFYYYSGGNEPSVISGQTHYNKWVHCAVSREGNTIRIFDNGQLTGTLDVSSYDTMNDSTVPLDIGADYADNYDMDGFISNVRIVKGTALYTSNFTPPTAPLTNVTNTVLLCCQSNTSATEGAVKPGTITANGNAVATNFNPFNTDINTVRGQETSYPTFNPLIVPGGGDSQGSGGSLSDGNLTIKSGGTTGNYHLASCSPSIPLTGKYYFEFTTISAINTDNNTIGIYNPESPVYASGDYARINPSFSGSFTTTKKRSGTATNLAGSAGDFSAGDVVNIAIDSDNRSIWFGRNGVYYEGNPSSGTGASYTNLTAGVEYVVRSFVYNSGGTEAEGRINFGQKPFKFPPPDGFQPLNGANFIPETVIVRPEQYVGVTTYTGNGGTKSINVGHKPDFVWVKARTGSARSHFLFDSVRGVQKFLQTDGNAAESALQTNTLSSFNNDGFTTGSRTGMNDSGVNYVTWTWKAGGNKNTFNVDDVGYASAAAAGLDGGTLTPSGASIGTKQGFSIIQWEGTNNIKTISHGLSQAPEFIINKNIDTSSDFYVGSSYLGTGNWLPYLALNGTAGEANNSDVWQQGGVPNATTFGVGAVGNSTGTHIAYLWHDVPGLQKFGKYIGNGSADGPFVELGFRPAVVLRKCSSTGGSGYDWVFIDTERNSHNISNNKLYPQHSGVENVNSDNSDSGDNSSIDILSNGFKVRASNGRMNQNGQTFIYAAWAEAPSFNLYAGQANAR